MKRISATLFFTLALFTTSHVANAGVTRTWHIAVEETEWNYFPNNPGQVDPATMDTTQRENISASPTHLGSVYKKVIYRAYTDATFTLLKETPSWQGFLGPVLHAEVGDKIKIILRNNAARPYSLAIRGLTLSNPSKDSKPGAVQPVPPGATHTFDWQVSELVGPGPADGSSIAWLYHSDVDAQRDLHSGLFGILIVTRRGLADASGAPVDIDQEVVLASSLTDENLSWFLPDNQRRLKNSESKTNTTSYSNSNRMANINGYTHGTMPEIRMRACNKVRLYHLALTDSLPAIALRWPGNPLLVDGHRTDTLTTLSHTLRIGDVVGTLPGKWTIGASLPELQRAGLYGHYTLSVADKPCH